MKKSTKRKKWGLKIDPLGLLTGATPVVAEKDAELELRGTTRDAFYRVSSGFDVTKLHLDRLAATANVAMALAREGNGSDWGPEIRAGLDAVDAIQKRFKTWKKVQMTQAERDAVWQMIEIHESQLDESTVRELYKAKDTVHQAIYGKPML